MKTHLTFVHAISRLHAGTGQGAGVIDLPIAREKATGLPFLPGSSLKGVLRASCEDEKVRERIFGPDATNIEPESNHASVVQFSDLRLLLFPVRSLVGTFAWVTSPYVMHRFVRDIKDAGIAPPAGHISAIDNVETCAIASSTSKICLESAEAFLEGLELHARFCEATKAWAEWIGQRVFADDAEYKKMFVERMCIVHDDIFNFLVETATEISARIKLKGDTKTVVDGGLWYEEALPTETILSGIALATPTKVSAISAEDVFKILQELTRKPLQLGGKATIGHGMCRVRLAKTAKEGNPSC